MTDITCVGELLVDMIGEETGGLKENPGFSKRAGGAPANVAVAASRLGAEVELVATVGDDEFGDFLVERMEKENVGTRNVRRSDLKTTLAFAALDEDAKPHFSFYRGADEKINKEQLEASGTLHLGSLPFTDRETSKNILELVESFDGEVSFDPNLREELMEGRYQEALEKVLENTDVLIAAEEEIELFGGVEEIPVNEVISTRGSEGADLYINAELACHVDAEEVEVVDTTGAGDALTGAYLVFRQELSREEALEKAVKAASESVKVKGAMESLPEKTDLQ
ncbi:MAG: carbohydrate kinase [Candidatus Nanohaloarchaea archaeon]|nr:carbohydrate kinase [Candidatus Nanohaloarchaea archaeon]